MVSFLFIVNPLAARGKAGPVAQQVHELCRKKGLDFDMQYTEEPGHATELATAGTKNFEVIVVVGGDGTVNEVVNGIVGSSSKFGIIPVGSGNDFARVMGIPIAFSEALDAVCKGFTRRVDLATAGSRYFNNGLGVGFDAWVVQESFSIRYLKGNMIYLAAVLKTVYKYQSPRMRLRYNHVDREEALFMVTVGNGTSLGGGFKLTPQAKVDDGLLDLNIICDLSVLKVFRNLIGVYSGNHTRLPEVTTDRTTDIFIESEEGFAAHVDGELLGLDLKELEVHIVPQALEVIVPHVD